MIAALLILLKDFECEQSRSHSIVDSFLAAGASILAWMIGLVILKLANVLVAGDAAIAFDITIGVLGAVVTYLYRLDGTLPDNK